MIEHIIDYPEAFQEMVNHLSGVLPSVKPLRDGYCLSTQDESFFIPMDQKIWPLGYTRNIKQYLTTTEEQISTHHLIHGKDSTENIVGCESKDGTTELFIEKNGIVSSKFIPQKYFILSGTLYGKGWSKLKGDLHYKYIKYFDDEASFMKEKKLLYGKNVFSVSDAKESAMLLQGFTYFKGMKVGDVSVLSFDIETMGLTYDSQSAVLLISNTYRNRGKIEKKLFSLDEYSSQKEMLEDWCAWVREKNPSVMLGHNIFGYDFKYLDFCAQKCGASLSLGRDGSELRFNRYPSKFRKDGSQDYEYHRAFIYGREIIDTMFLSYHFDFARKYESYALKAIIKHEGLEKKDRQFYQAGQIAQNWSNPEERKKIKKYAMDDADDALALYDLMIPAYFYWTSHIPKTFQTINYTATGSQLNSLLIRSYLQDGHSIPKTDDVIKFKGAISIGNPGLYSNCWKQDISSLYPSVILQYSVFDKNKDPKQHFLKMVNYFTSQRLRNKKLGKETNHRYYKDLEQSQKIAINSCYGLLGSGGLNFNSPRNAELVTEYGRNILKKAILWATGTEFKETITNEELEDETE